MVQESAIHRLPSTSTGTNICPEAVSADEKPRLPVDGRPLWAANLQSRIIDIRIYLVDAASLALTRHWGLLVFLIGALLIYAAFHPGVRDPVVFIAAVEKIALGVIVLGTSLRRHRLATAIGRGPYTSIHDP